MTEVTDYLKEEVDSWRKILNKSLLKVENQRQIMNHKPKYPEGTRVWFPFGPNTDLFLLTLKVWCLRYDITPEFLLKHLTDYFRKMRRNQDGNDIHIGIPAHMLAGVKARAYIEEMVVKEFPNGENRKMLAQPELIEVRVEEYHTLDQMLRNYDKSVREGQKKFDDDMKKLNRVSNSRRKFRQVLRENL